MCAGVIKCHINISSSHVSCFNENWPCVFRLLSLAYILDNWKEWAIKPFTSENVQWINQENGIAALLISYKKIVCNHGNSIAPSLVCWYCYLEHNFVQTACHLFNYRAFELEPKKYVAKDSGVPFKKKNDEGKRPSSYIQGVCSRLTSIVAKILQHYRLKKYTKVYAHPSTNLTKCSISLELP